MLHGQRNIKVCYESICLRGLCQPSQLLIFGQHCKTDGAKERTDMGRLTTGIRSEKCVVRRFRRCANVIQCTYTNPDSTVQPTAHLGYMV